MGFRPLSTFAGEVSQYGSASRPVAASTTRKPAALVSKRRVKEAIERIDYKGSVVVALDEEAMRADIQELLDQGVESIAISLLWSFRNPVHEQRIRELIRKLSPGTFVVLSSEVSPVKTSPSPPMPGVGAALAAAVARVGRARFRLDTGLMAVIPFYRRGGGIYS